MMTKCINTDENGYKISQNGPWELWTRNLEALAFGGRVLSQGLCFFLAFWRHLDDSGRHFGAQLDAKGLPKSSIFAPSRQTIEKNDVQERVLKKHGKIIGI